MLILFDLDDTLIDDAAATSLAVDALAAHLAIATPLPDFRARWFAALERHFARFTAGELSFQEHRRARARDTVSADLSDLEADALFAVYLAAYEENWRLFPDVTPCLDALVGHTLGVVSNGNAHQQRLKLARTGVLDRFTCVVVSEELGYAKPDPRIFEKARELAGMPASAALHVGDRLDNDVLGAQRAGIRPVWLDRRSNSLPSHGAVTRLTSLVDLPPLVIEATPR